MLVHFSQEHALESSKTARDKEWNTFMNDLQDSYQKVEKAYEQKEDEIRERYTKLEENFKLQ